MLVHPAARACRPHYADPLDLETLAGVAGIAGNRLVLVEPSAYSADDFN